MRKYSAKSRRLYPDYIPMFALKRETFKIDYVKFKVVTSRGKNGFSYFKCNKCSEEEFRFSTLYNSYSALTVYVLGKVSHNLAVILEGRKIKLLRCKCGEFYLYVSGSKYLQLKVLNIDEVNQRLVSDAL